jgi:NADH-quinone oxidoreductase subunit C
MHNQLTADLMAAFPDKVTEDPAKNDFYPAVLVPAEDLLEVLAWVKNDLKLDHLANISSVDQKETFEVVYHLHSFYGPDQLQLKVSVPRGVASVPSAFGLYATADWQEREIFDLMGISFTGHPNLQRILMPDDYPGHPLRKDFTKGR